ncbi:ABC transporter substrate-binding protein [Clostridium thermarum]|uniref:ABC transporter substrate-binding protein n=1 Tax=Clostridium thermarum TaxID=1716543 RepID=UPI0013D17D34|nr:ABC transporter substrate-binding protein [Clostridium thermarum]
MRKREKLIAILCMTAFVLSGCLWKKEEYEVKREVKQYEEIITIGNKKRIPEVAQDRKDTIIVGVNDFKGELNPLYATDNYDLWATNLVFEGLLAQDESGKIVSNIAEKWEVDEEGKKYSFKLKEGVKFSDGSELTTEDVAFTFTAICDPSYDGPYAAHMRLLEGYNEYKMGEEEDVIGIQIDSKYEISFYFRESDSSLIYDFQIGILPKAYYGFEKGEISKLKALFTKPIGAGAYAVEVYNEGSDIKLKKNEYYWKGVPSTNNIIFKKTPGNEGLKQLASGEIDMVRLSANLENVNYLQSLQFADLHLYDNNGYQYIGLNLRYERFKDKKVRQALLYGLNRAKFVEDFYGEFGSVYNTPFAKCSWAYPQGINEYNYDKAKAESLLEEAGWTKKEDGYRYDKDGNKFTIKWSTYEGNKYVNALKTAVINDWKELGIDVTVEEMTFQQLVEKVYDSRDFEMYNMSWFLTADPDPSAIFSAKEDVPGGYNAVGWRNDESEELIKAALKENDIEKRKEIYNSWGKLANEELPYLYLNQNKELLAVNMRITGLSVAPYKEWTAEAYKLSIINEEE